MSDITKVHYWIDIIVKTGIGVIVALAGMDYKQVKSGLSDLQEAKYKIATQVEVMQVEVKVSNTRLEKMDQKLDQLLERRR